MKTFILISSMFVSTAAFAHPGHGASGLAHDLQHSLLDFGYGFAAIAAIFWVARNYIKD